MMKVNRIQEQSRQSKLNHFNSLPYDIVVKLIKGKFYLYIPEISLVAADEDLNQAYKDLYKRKQDFFNRILDCEAEDEIVLPRKVGQSKKTFYQLKMFIYKLLIICFLGGTTLVFSGVVIKNKIANISGADVVKKISRGIVLEAKRFTNTPDYHKQIRIGKFREFLEAFHPWINEFKAVFSSSEEVGRNTK